MRKQSIYGEKKDNLKTANNNFQLQVTGIFLSTFAVILDVQADTDLIANRQKQKHIPSVYIKNATFPPLCSYISQHEFYMTSKEPKF